MALGLGLGLGFQRGGTGDPLGTYALIDGGVSYRPLAVDDANVNAAWRRDFGVTDYQLVDGGTNYTPLAVDDATNDISVRA
jgi:hypothetical protein